LKQKNPDPSDADLTALADLGRIGDDTEPNEVLGTLL